MIREAELKDIPAILEIFNDAVLNTTAIYAYKPATLEDRTAWFEKKREDGFPVLVFDVDGTVAGFAAYGTFRAFPAYKYTVEHSVYVYKDFRGRGIASQLVKRLIEIADGQGLATMVAGIDADNEASILLHKKLGFKDCGTVKKAGFKFGRWLDLTFMQYELKGPEKPVEDR
ncbi:MAG: N-acetyltransferase family protein [Deferribacterales bacterium]